MQRHVKGGAIAARGGCLTVLLAATPAIGWAHSGERLEPNDLWSAWTWALPITIPLAITAWLYLRGAAALWRRAGVGRGLARWRAGAFAAGWLLLVVALVSPLHALGETLFSAHMAQHELLMTVAAPLLVLGRPIVPAIFALPPRVRSAATAWSQNPRFRRGWERITRPGTAWLIHAIVIWVWHAPLLYEATLGSGAVHALQHLCFIGSALLFWWTVLEPAWAERGLAMLSLFTTMVHTGALGAILALSGTLWYPAYADTTRAWGLTALEDQQLGGMIMWIPGGAAYLVAALGLLGVSLRESSRRGRSWTTTDIGEVA
jgi:putative membrane protein